MAHDGGHSASNEHKANGHDKLTFHVVPSYPFPDSIVARAYFHGAGVPREGHDGLLGKEGADPAHAWRLAPQARASTTKSTRVPGNRGAAHASIFARSRSSSQRRWKASGTATVSAPSV